MRGCLTVLLFLAFAAVIFAQGGDRTVRDDSEGVDNIPRDDSLETASPTTVGRSTTVGDTTKHFTSSTPSSTDEELSSTTLPPEVTTLGLLQKWTKFENLTKMFAKNAVKRMLPRLMESGTGNMNISASCQRDVLRLIVGFRDIKTWAFRFLDASGKLVDGMLGGTMASQGEFDLCLDTRATETRRGKERVLFTGQYCALDLKPPLPPKKAYYRLNDIVEELEEFSKGGNIISETAKAAQFFHFISLRIGLCIPSGCSSSDLQQIADKAAEHVYWTAKVRRCEVKEENNFTPLIIAVITLCSFFGFLLLLGSIVDLYHMYAQRKIKSTPLEVLVCFSLVSNFKKLVNTESSRGSMACLHGFRFLSISWIVLGHTYLNINYNIAKGLRKGLEFQRDFAFQAVVNASVAVDTFFFIGGLLVCYATIKVTRESKRPFSIPLYLLHRILRLLPVYAVILAFIFLAPLVGSGPIWHETIDPFLEACYSNWWTNLLFVNNFVRSQQICLPQSWYISCDMQLYLASLLVLLPILRWPKVGLSIAVLGVVGSVVCTAAMTYVNRFPPTMLFIHPDPEQRVQFWSSIYFKPYSHAGPYCVGLLVGYLLATRPKLHFNKVTRVFGWSAAIACNMAVLYGVHDWNRGREPELVETLLYSGLHRVAWSAGVAWVVINCATGQGGVVNYILSWKVWVPLGRLTYCIYLIHPIAQVAVLGNARIHIQTAHFFAVWMNLGHVVTTVGCAFCASMLVEAPFISLEKILLRIIAGKSPTPHTNGHASAVGEDTAPKTAASRNGSSSHL